MVCLFFFCKQKTAYEMRISDCSSDVCSSDLFPLSRCRACDRLPIGQTERGESVNELNNGQGVVRSGPTARGERIASLDFIRGIAVMGILEIGRVSGRERVCQYV